MSTCKKKPYGKFLGREGFLEKLGIEQFQKSMEGGGQKLFSPQELGGISPLMMPG